MSTTLAQYTITNITNKDLDLNDKPNLLAISDNIKIVDSRLLKDFKDQTFGGYKLSQAILALDKAILEDKIETVLHWTLQLFFSGLIMSLWNKFISIATKSINIYNPKLPEFLYNKTLQWDNIIDNCKYTKDNILLLRNHPSIRLLLAEMACVLCLSRKHKITQLPKIKKEEFIIDNFKNKLEARDNNLISEICTDGDPKEILIAINEMYIHILNKNTPKALYWLNWVIEWEKINSKKYGKYECGSRIITGIDGKYYKDVVWLIWSVINNIRYKNFSNNTLIINEISNLYKLYTHKFTPASRHRKLNLIIWAILYMTETIDYATVLIDRPHLLFQSLLGFDKIIMNLKCQEVHKEIAVNTLNVIIENNYKPKKLNSMYTLDRMMYS